jgi:ribonuclease D
MPAPITLHQQDIPADLTFPNGVAIDTETMGLVPYRDRLCVVQLSSGDGTAHLVQIEGNKPAAPYLCRLLTDAATPKLFHFGRFDIAVLYHTFGVLCDNVYCTKIASRLVRTYTDRHGLKELCKELLGIELSKTQQSSDWGAATLSLEQQHYAASDVLHLHALRDVLQARLLREGRDGLANSCFAFLPTRARLDVEGWPEIDIFSHN